MSLTDRQLRPEEHGFGPPPQGGPIERQVQCSDCGEPSLAVIQDRIWICAACSEAAQSCAASRIPRWVILALPWLLIGACAAALNFA